MWPFRKRSHLLHRILSMAAVISTDVSVMRAQLNSMEQKVMADLNKLKASVADLTARVKNAATVEAGVAAIVQTMAQQNRDLADKIASMDAGTITQTDLDDLSTQVGGLGDALDQATSSLAKAAAYDPTNPSNEAGASSGDGMGQTPAADGAPDGSAPSPDANSGSGQTFGAKHGSGSKAAPLGGTSADERAEAERAAEAEASKPSTPPQPSAADTQGQG
jgi:hypothetical protein